MNQIKQDKKKFKMTYCIGTNFDPELIEIISKYNKQNIFNSVFGKLKSDFIGGGRASTFLPDISMKELKSYIKLCHDNDLAFNYLINPMCMENQEVESSSHMKILRYLYELVNIGIDSITINSPYLCEIIKKQFPDLKVVIGLYAYIYDIHHVRYWTNLGADEITLGHKINRDFEALEKMLIYTRDKNVSMRLIANNVCLHSCPYAVMHGTGQSHASQKCNASKGEYIDYCILKCLNEKVRNPVNLISSDWIRPEDIGYYEELCKKTNNYKLSIKLVERTKTTEFLTRVIKAYATRSYDGNLLDILLWPKMSEMLKVQKTPEQMKLLASQYNVDELTKYFDIFNLPEVYIDNKKLNGFLDKFIKNFECDKKLCAGMNNQELSEGSKGVSEIICSYCNEWVNKAISYDNDEVKKWLNKYDDVEMGLKESRIFSKI